MFVTEELSYANNGYLLSDSAGKYKIPTVSTVPRKLRVALLKGCGDKFNLYSSKVKIINQETVLVGTVERLLSPQALTKNQDSIKPVA